jgi:cellulose synthase/poly-beta-1,6-N-acetylglucosamine synthase-like glycosyltransferase
MQFIKRFAGSLLLLSFCTAILFMVVYSIAQYGLLGVLYILQGSIFLSALYVIIPYLLFVLLFPLYRKIFRTVLANTPPVTNFILMIPAHNEAQVISRLLDSIKKQEYPSKLLTTVVVADNCIDETEAIALSYGVVCYHRNTNFSSDKSQALYFGAQMMLEAGLLQNAVVCILDADCTLDARYLESLDYAFSLPGAAPVIQSFRCVKNRFQTDITILDAAAEALRQWVKSGTRKLLGLDNFIYGLGCAMRGDLFLKITSLPDLTLTEDKDWKAYLVNNGLEVNYCPTAQLNYEVVTTGKAFKKQRERWIAGRIKTFRKYSLRMVGNSIITGNLSQFDFAVDLMHPPRSVITILTLLFGMLAFVFPRSSFLPHWVWFVTLFIIAAYAMTGLWLIKAKLKQYLVVFSGASMMFTVMQSTVKSLLGRSVKTWDATRKKTV